MRFDEKVGMGISWMMNLTVPENSCIALEIDKIGRRLRIKKAEMSQFRVYVYYGWRKIKNRTQTQDNIEKKLDNGLLGDCKLDAPVNGHDVIMNETSTTSVQA